MKNSRNLNHSQSVLHIIINKTLKSSHQSDLQVKLSWERKDVMIVTQSARSMQKHGA